MNIIERSKEVFEQEATELQLVGARIGQEMVQVVELIYQNNQKVVFTGIGKTGIIAKKIAASMASTGTPSIFMNAAEAIHGDLGMVAKGDIVIIISNSGESEEILNLIAPLKRIGCPIVAMTGNVKSSLAQQSDHVLDICISREACKMGLAPTTSTTAALVMGDALTVCLMEKREFRPENFAIYHPGGALGRRMLTKVTDCMTTTVPMVNYNASFREVVTEVSSKKLGITMVADTDGNVTGIITDGDIRRTVQKHDDLQALTAKEIMTHGFKAVLATDMINDALEIMDLNKITTLAVIESNDAKAPIIGILHIHDVYGFRKK